ncbi:MAG TPA: hypothetical protein VHZ09_05535 [Acidobacteriaceae bacterium]|jgi:hypothetical protein|nr:hypothetical protein [Acidobacteriaceae bacterium]
MDDPQVAAALQACRQIEGIAAAARHGTPPAGSVSYAPAFLADSWQSFAELVATVHALLAKLKPVATVETTQDGQSIETRLRYTGGTDSVSTPNLSLRVASVHLRSLERIFALRNAVAGAFVAAASTILTLSASIANPLLLLHALSLAKSLQEALQRLLSAIEAAA